MTIKELSLSSGIAEITIRSWIRDGKLKATKDNSNPGCGNVPSWIRWEIEESDFNDFVKNHKADSYSHNVYKRYVRRDSVAKIENYDVFDVSDLPLSVRERIGEYKDEKLCISV